MSVQPLCFVLMPFGSKPDPTGGPDIDFDRVYAMAIKPGIVDAGMVPIRADEEKLGGIIHKAMFERLLVCDFAVADLTTSNANVLYELGVRHAARPRTTLTVYAESHPLPFDVKLLRTQPYQLGQDHTFPEPHAQRLRQSVSAHLVALRSLEQRDCVQDSPLFQLVTGWHPQPLTPDATESFQGQVKANEAVKERLRRIRSGSQSAEGRRAMAPELARIRSDLLAAETSDPGVLSELLLANRAFEDWSGMIEVYEGMPDQLRSQVPVRQQAAFAYNRRAEQAGSPQDRATAVHLLERLEAERGPSSETSGLLGRIYKSQWSEARRGQDAARARTFLIQAVEAYVRGFEIDWRDIYPGINAVTLLDVQGGARALARKDRLLPVVRFATEQRLASPAPDYWDQATLLELAVLSGEVDRALDALDSAVAASSEPWQPKSTADNLRIICEAREERGQLTEWVRAVIDVLDPRPRDG
ncbi:TRAFs-binding domain-containing protein [Modestobacter marinus]|uniref:TRAFs-binding domain-containing protein n=1 Tax=Modestobacter marinus TaxID=477641 RepID=UPI001C982EDF|nr:TRAFs-binding domain-containing protein [Modestobacter marinus]